MQLVRTPCFLFQNYLWDPEHLCDGPPPNDRGCRACGKIGHLVRDCPRRRAHEENHNRKQREKNIENHRKMAGEVAAAMGQKLNQQHHHQQMHHHQQQQQHRQPQSPGGPRTPGKQLREKTHPLQQQQQQQPGPVSRTKFYSSAEKTGVGHKKQQQQQQQNAKKALGQAIPTKASASTAKDITPAAVRPSSMKAALWSSLKKDESLLRMVQSYGSKVQSEINQGVEVGPAGAASKRREKQRLKYEKYKLKMRNMKAEKKRKELAALAAAAAAANKNAS